MTTLIIIGNGFDIAHNLKTSYTSFIQSIRKEDYPENTLIQVLKNEYLNHTIWADIEYTYFQILNNYNNEKFFRETLYLHAIYRTPEELDKDFEELKSLLTSYLLNQQKDLKKISSYEKLFTSLKGKNSIILDFNYTNTIERYNIDGVKHIKIHGDINDEKNPIIFGYGANDQELKKLSDLNDKHLIKNIKKLKYQRTNRKRDFINELNTSKGTIDIIILGHSCSLSDKIFLGEIFSHDKIKKVYICYYVQDGIDNHDELIGNINRINELFINGEKRDLILNKLSVFTESYEMVQHDSGKDVKDKFDEFISILNNILRMKSLKMSI